MRASGRDRYVRSTTARMPQRQATERGARTAVTTGICVTPGEVTHNLWTDVCVNYSSATARDTGARMCPVLMAREAFEHLIRDAQAGRQDGPELADLLYGTGGPPRGS
jgi:hypothetical protein